MLKLITRIGLQKKGSRQFRPIILRSTRTVSRASEKKTQTPVLNWRNKKRKRLPVFVHLFCAAVQQTRKSCFVKEILPRVCDLFLPDRKLYTSAVRKALPSTVKVCKLKILSFYVVCLEHKSIKK